MNPKKTSYICVTHKLSIELVVSKFKSISLQPMNTKIITFWSLRLLKTQNSQFGIRAKFVLDNLMPHESKKTFLYVYDT